MRHPFELEIADIEIIEASQIQELTDEETQDISGGRSDKVTTLALGEEGGGVTTLALGEEGGCFINPPIATTLALGEEGGGFH